MNEPGRDTPARQSSLFREAALARLNSPEQQLDQRIRLVPPAMRLLALAAAAIIVAGLVWAVYGSILTRASGRGVLLSDGKGSFVVEPVTSGPVTEVLVKQGARVKAGTVIARIKQASLAAQLTGTTARLTAMQEDLVKLKAADALIMVQSEDIFHRQTAAIDQQIAAGKKRAQNVLDVLQGDEAMQTKGLISKLEVVNMQQQYDNTMLDIANAAAKRIEVESALHQKRESLAERQRQLQVGIDAVKADVERLKTELAIGSSVTAPVDGVIDEIRVGVGDVVSFSFTSAKSFPCAPIVCTVIATIGEVSAVPRFEVVALFGDDMGKRVTAGMDVHVHPVTVRREEHGAMVGRIKEVTERSVSQAEVNAILRNSTLTKTLMGDGAPVLARITLVETKETQSGFAWWIGKGPHYKVTRGTLIDVEVIISRHAPIALVVPALRKLLGLEG